MSKGGGDEQTRMGTGKRKHGGGGMSKQEGRGEVWGGGKMSKLEGGMGMSKLKGKGGEKGG